MEHGPIATQWQTIQERVARACARRGRDPAAVRVVAATKTIAPARILEAYRAGARCFGENRVQEREDKQAALSGMSEIEWHLLGPLQRNKAARALTLFDVIESVGSIALAERLQRLAAAPVNILLEINLAAEPQKHGFLPGELAAAAQSLAALNRLRVNGLMAVPPAAATAESSRPWFARLAAISEDIRIRLGHQRQGWELSMGMSQDFEVAVEEGATTVRIGTALFGERPYAT